MRKILSALLVMILVSTTMSSIAGTKHKKSVKSGVKKERVLHKKNKNKLKKKKAKSKKKIESGSSSDHDH